MLDDNLPTYRFQPTSDSPLATYIYFTHNGSESVPEYLVKRPSPTASRNQYALGLFDAKHASVLYAEVLVRPEWSQPTLSAAEIRANNGLSEVSPLVPETFDVSLYNPDQSVAVKRHQGSWGKSDSWEFEVPERTFRLPSASKLDQDQGASAAAAALVPKVVFRWKKEGRRDMMCYMTGRSVGGKKNKDPDITVAMFRGGKGGENIVQVYEPNMARVEIEDRKGLEVAFVLSAQVIQELYLSPKQNVFNASGGVIGGPAPVNGNGGRKTPTGLGIGVPPTATMSGGLNNIPPPNSAQADPWSPSTSAAAATVAADDKRRKAEIEAETRRLQAMVAEEERQAREQERRDAEEAKRIKKMIEKEDKDRRRREAEIEKETERLRKQYGVPKPSSGGGGGPPQGHGGGHGYGGGSVSTSNVTMSGGAAGWGAPSSPPLPPRPLAQSQGSWFAPPSQPPRPQSVGPGPRPSASGEAASYYFPGPPQEPTMNFHGGGTSTGAQQGAGAGGGSGGKKKSKLDLLLNKKNHQRKRSL